MKGRDPGPFDLDGDLTLIPTQFDALEEVLAVGGLDTCASSVSDWSVGQQLIHVALVSVSIARALGRLLRSGGLAEGETSEMATAILSSGQVPRGRGQAPTASRREETPSASEIIAVTVKARKRWASFADRASDIRACTDRFPHPILGPLTAAEWVRFQAVHSAHHLLIVDDIRSA